MAWQATFDWVVYFTVCSNLCTLSHSSAVQETCMNSNMHATSSCWLVITIPPFTLRWWRLAWFVSWFLGIPATYQVCLRDTTVSTVLDSSCRSNLLSHPITVCCLFVCWLLNVPATCECISSTDLLNFMCCHTEIDVADQTFHLTQSQYTDTRPTNPSTDPVTPGAWQGNHWSAKS